MVLSKTILASAISILMAASSLSALEYITSGKEGSDRFWSNIKSWDTLVSWNPYEVQGATELPNSNENSVSLNHSNLFVDGNYTTKGIYTNSGLADGIVEMKDNSGVYNPQAQSLTIDLAKVNSDTVGKAAVKLRGSNQTHSLSFKNGVYNFTDSANLGSSNVVFETRSNSSDNTKLKTITFQEESVINSTQNLITYGYENGAEKNVFNFDGNVFLKNNSSWKSFTIIANTTNIGGNFNSANIDVNSTSILNVKNGATVNANGFFNVNENATANVLTGGKLYSFNQINVKSGAVLNANGSIFSSCSDVTKVDNIIVSANGKMVVGNSGVINLQGGYSNIRVEGIFEVNSAENSIIVSRHLRLYKGAKLILNTSNALRESTSKAGTVLLMDTSACNYYVDVNANNHLAGFSFKSSSNVNVFVNLGQECNLLELDNISYETFSGFNANFSGSVFLNFINFKNNTVKILDGYRLGDSLDNILAEGFEDFYLEKTDGGYWLNAVQIPEASTFAGIAGICSLALVFIRRRK